MAQMVKNMPPMQETRVLFMGWEKPQRREWLSIPLFLPREFHGQRSLAGYSPWGLISERTYTNEQAVKLSGSVWRSSCLFIQIMLVFAPYPCILILFF